MFSPSEWLYWPTKQTAIQPILEALEEPDRLDPEIQKVLDSMHDPESDLEESLQTWLATQIRSDPDQPKLPNMKLIKSEFGVRVYEFEKFADEAETSIWAFQTAIQLIPNGVRTVFFQEKEGQEKEGLSWGIFFIVRGEVTNPTFCFHTPKEIITGYFKLDNVPFQRLVLQSSQDFLLYDKTMLPDNPTVHLQKCNIKGDVKIEYPVEISDGTVIGGELTCPSLKSDGTCVVNGKRC